MEEAGLGLEPVPPPRGKHSELFVVWKGVIYDVVGLLHTALPGSQGLFVCLLYIQAWISAMGYFVKYPIAQRSQTFFKITLPIWPRKAHSRTLMLACFIHSKTNGVWYHCPVVRGWGRTISHLDFSHNWWYFNLNILFLLLLFSLNIKQLEKIYLCLLFYSWELENSIAVTRLVL